VSGATIGAGFLGAISSRNGIPELREAAQICEDGGFASFWVADQRWMRDVYVSLTDLAARTRRLSLGTRVTDPFSRHPALTAVAAATLDEASRGRAILGIGAGGSGFRQLGISRARPAVAVREAIDVIRRLWRGEEFEVEGQIVSWGRGALEFECRHDIPIVIAARGPRLLELAGEVADGAIVASGVSAGGVEWARERIGAGEERAGKSVGSTELLHMTYLTIDRDRRRARQTVKQALVATVVGSHPTYDFLRANGLEIPPDLFAYLDSGGCDPARIIPLIPDSFCDELAVAGTLDDCAEQLADLLEAGIQHPLLTPIPAEHGDDLEMLRQVAREILPHLRPRVAST
jgi:5,10-methylenetetrahydromethanopterin reductase